MPSGDCRGRISTSHDRAFPGEEVELTFELTNKGLPLPWLEIEVELPYRLATGKRPLSPYIWERLRWVTALSPGQVITWKHTLEAKAKMVLYCGFNSWSYQRRRVNGIRLVCWLYFTLFC
jgi:hypothetical protein